MSDFEHNRQPGFMDARTHFEMRDIISDNLHREQAELEQDLLTTFRADVMARMGEEGLLGSGDHMWLVFETGLSAEPDSVKGLNEGKEIAVIADIAHDKSSVEYPMVRILSKELIGEQYLVEDVTIYHTGHCQYYTGIVTEADIWGHRKDRRTKAMVFSVRDDELKFWNKQKCTPVEDIETERDLLVPYGVSTDQYDREYALAKAGELLAMTEQLTPMYTSKTDN